MEDRSAGVKCLGKATRASRPAEAEREDKACAPRSLKPPDYGSDLNDVMMIHVSSWLFGVLHGLLGLCIQRFACHAQVDKRGVAQSVCSAEIVPSSVQLLVIADEEACERMIESGNNWFIEFSGTLLRSQNK